MRRRGSWRGAGWIRSKSGIAADPWQVAAARPPVLLVNAGLVCSPCLRASTCWFHFSLFDTAVVSEKLPRAVTGWLGGSHGPAAAPVLSSQVRGRGEPRLHAVAVPEAHQSPPGLGSWPAVPVGRLPKELKPGQTHGRTHPCHDVQPEDSLRQRCYLWVHPAQ